MPYKLTKIDLAALRKCDSLVVAISPEGKRVEAIKRVSYQEREKNPFAQEVVYSLSDVPVGFYTMRGTVNKDGARCFAMMSQYSSPNPFSSIIATLRVGDEILFNFYPDAHSTDALAKARFHGDCLYLCVNRDGKRVAEFVVDTCVCQDNTARMCRGIPDADHWLRAAGLLPAA